LKRRKIGGIRALATVSLAGIATACGAAQSVSAEENDCRKQCDLEYMSCMERMTCVDGDGQTVPCVDDCERVKGECLEACSEK